MKNFTRCFVLVAFVTMMLCPDIIHAQADYLSVDDSYVHSTNSTTNYGSNTTVVTKISSNSRYAYYKFDVSNITGNVNSAILRLNVKSVTANTSRAVYAVVDDSWTEESITWDNKPALGSVIASTTISTSDDEKYVEWDLTSYVSTEVDGDGFVSIAVSDPNSTDTGVDFYTKENTNKRPFLRVDASRFNVVSNQDAYVHSNNPTNNYGTIDHVVTKTASDTRYAFYKFDLANYAGDVHSAILKLNVKSVSANSTRAVYGVSDDSWTDVSITWNNQPTVGSELASKAIATSDNGKYVEWDITSYVQSELSGNGIISICVKDPGSSSTGIDFYTEEKGGAQVPLLVTTFSGSDTLPPVNFVHPGGLFTQTDLDRMRSLVQAGTEPHYSSFEELSDEDKASYNYTVRGNSTMTQVDRGGTNGVQWESDATAAYLNAIMWAVTQDSRHADKCVEIFNAWKNITYVGGTGTYPLNAGLFIWKMVEAAEIIKSTYTGWSSSDIQDFKDMLVYPGYSDVAVPSSVNTTSVGSFYWRIYNGDPGRHGNQDMIAYRGMITMAVFLDNGKMYHRALRYFTSQSGRTDDIPMPTGPSPSGNQTADNTYFTTFQYQGTTGSTVDYGYNGQLKHYVWENGQCQEASRDQEHVILGLGMAAMIAKVAYNQGDDIWDMYDNRLLKGFEYGAKYNTSYLKSYPDQLTSWEPTSSNGEFIQRLDRTGRWSSKAINPYFESNFTNNSRGNFPGKRPIFEMAYAHFQIMGKESEAVWTKRALDLAIELEGYEKTGYSLDSPGWGALCFRLPSSSSRVAVAGIGSEDKSSDLGTYPNPVDNELTVNLKTYEPGMKVKVLDVSGREIFVKNLTGISSKINFGSVTPGVYFLKIMDEKNRVLKQSKIIKE